MARRARYHMPGATYHVILRGNDGQKIFFEDSDRCKLCLLIQEGIERFGHRILAYCFMSNHIHLAIQVGQTSLSCIMQNLAFRYAQYMNWKWERVGHLFQGRFKSILVDESRYLKELVRYMHLNPVRAHVAHLPEHYPWSSHNVYLGTADLVWLTTSSLLRTFAEDPVDSVSRFQKFVHAGIECFEKTDFKRGMYAGIYGDDDFIKKVKDKQDSNVTNSFDMSELVDAACDLYNIELEVLRKPGKSQQEATLRAILALLVRQTPHLTLEELGRLLHRDPSSLCKQAARLTAKKEMNEMLRAKVLELKEHMQMPECQA